MNQIPKVIHYCWLSNDPFPEQIQACLDTWSAVLPDYEIKLWNFDRFPKEKSAWVRDAFDAGKYAFAADYIRSYALFTEGGIYLDSDIEVLKSFDPLLHLPYFMGFENGSGCIDAGIMAALPGHSLYKMLLDHYDSTPFVAPDGTLNTTPLPVLISKLLKENGFTIKPIETPDDFDFTEKVISVLPFDYFSPINQTTKAVESTDRTMAIHRFAGSWLTGWPLWSHRIRHLLGNRVYNIIAKAKRIFSSSK